MAQLDTYVDRPPCSLDLPVRVHSIAIASSCLGEKASWEEPVHGTGELGLGLSRRMTPAARAAAARSDCTKV